MAPSPAEGAAYGLVQGLTEFLPISSSAHLVLLPWLFGWNDPGLAFDVALHLGTLFAVAWYFGGDWVRLVRAAVADRRAAGPEAQLFWKVALASVPAAIVGLALEHAAETAFRDPR
ncbi:MAG: undecaprenyl-diphosphate phosphatase, partial [Candidatus Binatia bacterium]